MEVGVGAGAVVRVGAGETQLALGVERGVVPREVVGARDVTAVVDPVPVVGPTALGVGGGAEVVGAEVIEIADGVADGTEPAAVALVGDGSGVATAAAGTALSGAGAGPLQAPTPPSRHAAPTAAAVNRPRAPDMTGETTAPVHAAARAGSRCGVGEVRCTSRRRRS